MKILFLTDNFPPEVNAPASRTYEHCVEWAKAGAEITVITCVPNYPKGQVFEGYKNKWYQVEWMGNIKVVRVRTYMSENQGFFKRTLDYMSFAFMAFWVGLNKKTDIIIATSPQFFTAVTGFALHFFKKKPWIFEVRDLWPESIDAVGAFKQKSILRFLEKIELFLYRKATNIVVVTDSFKDNMVQRGINPGKIYTIKNGVKLDNFYPKPKDAELLDKLQLRNKFVVAYIGTHGLAHKLDFILESAKLITDTNIHILLIGDGAERDNLLKLKEKLSLNNVTMLASVSKNEIARYISISDISLVNLKKSDTFKKVIPSKIFENAAMQRPILLGVEGEAQSIIEHYQAGLCFEPENTSDFIRKLELLAADKKLYSQCQIGCKNLAYDFNREKLAKRMFEIIESSAFGFPVSDFESTNKQERIEL